MKLNFLCACAILIATTTVTALEYPLPPPGENIVGQVQTIQSAPDDTLSIIGMSHDIGYYEMVEANPALPKNSKLKVGTVVTIPSEFILPQTRNGLVVNLAELRIYYFPTNEAKVYTFPISAGREGWNTPIASTKVIRKKEDPSWTVPDSIMRESLAQGKPIKKYWPPGPDNPLGKYAIYLGIPGIRIHGTNMQGSVGRRVSHGCIRMLANDIKFLYHNVPLETPVQITHEQNKVGWKGHVLYLESEVPFHEYHDAASAEQAIAAMTENRPATINWDQVHTVVEEGIGIPTPIGSDQN